MDERKHTDDGSRGPIRWMAGHSVSANLLMLFLLVGGIIAGFSIKKEVFPDFELNFVNITVPYPGASPQEVERGILLAIEEAVDGLDGIEKVMSTAREGAAVVTVEVIEGENVQRLAQEIKAEVDRITSFPEDAEEPQVTIASRKRYVISLALYGDVGERVLRDLAEKVRERLLRDAAIMQVELTGVRDYEIVVEVDQRTLRTYGITLGEVADRIRSAAVELPGGAIKSPGGDVLLRMKERRDYGREFARVPVITDGDGARLTLGEIGRIEDGFAEVDSQATYNGKRAVMMEVYRVGDQTPIAVADAVKAVVSELQQTLPAGIGIDLRNDRSDVYRQRMGLMQTNGYLGLVLVFLLLSIFLEPRLAFWVSLGIPISFLGGLILLHAMGVSINMITMFAFIVTLGIVVDDAIVVGENVYHYREKGMPWFQAAVRGAREISTPVIFGVLTNMVAFAPLLFVPGFIGKIYKPIPLVVMAVFLVSLVESLFVLPAHLGHHKQRRAYGVFARLEHWQQVFGRGFKRMVDRYYPPVLTWMLRWRYVSAAAAAALLIVTVGYIQSGRQGFELFPKVESDYAKVTAVLPFGSAFAKTEAVEQRIVSAADRVARENGGKKAVVGIFARIRDNEAEVYAYLPPPGSRPLATGAFTERWREAVGQIPGLEALRFESDAGGPGRGNPIAVELAHQEIGVLEAAGAQLAEALSYYPGVTDIDDGFSPGKRQLDFFMLPEARSLGLTSRDVARQVRHSFYGAEALRQQRGRNEVKVMVRLPRSERISEHNLEQMILRTPAGGEIPLAEAVRIVPGRAYTDIERRDGRRVITVSADIRPRSKAGQVLGDLMAHTLPQLQREFPGLTYSFEGHQADQRESLQSLGRGMVVVLLVVFAMLAVPLNSFIQPAIIMAAIPFGIVGALVGHMVMGYSLSVLSMFGVLALTGVVINDALVLIDMANRRRLAGDAAVAAIITAGQMRFRPILLTTVTTFGGLAPMIFETSRQARFLIPMAISLGFGVLFATVITLGFVPCLYVIMDDIGRVGGRRHPEKEAAAADGRS